MNLIRMTAIAAAATIVAAAPALAGAIKAPAPQKEAAPAAMPSNINHAPRLGRHERAEFNVLRRRQMARLPVAHSRRESATKSRATKKGRQPATLFATPGVTFRSVVAMVVITVMVVQPASNGRPRHIANRSACGGADRAADNGAGPRPH
jgi:hypothetical protein